MEQGQFRVYGYRWVVLSVFMLVIFMNQLSWISFAPITGPAAAFYGVADLQIGLLSLVFMLVYIIISVPASWMIDSYGLRVSVGIGAALTGVFGFMRGLVADNYTLVLVAQIGLAVGQPFLLNAMTSVAARWFPVGWRAIAAGMGSLAMYVGIAVGLVLTPYLTANYDIITMLMIYGVASPVVAIIFFVFIKDRPPTPPCAPEDEERSLVFEGFRDSLHQPTFILLLVIFFVGLGVFNAVTTWIEDILRPRNFSVIEAGHIGGIMILGGIMGALLVPLIAEHYNKRTPLIRVAIIGATPGLIGVTFTAEYSLIILAAFFFGFFLLGVGPLGFQYGAEITYPAPEGMSNGLMLLVGQISGVMFILGMDSFKNPVTGSMSIPLSVLIGLMGVGIYLSFRLKEPEHQSEEKKEA
ncbi:MAG: MFS transporter [Candidatus Marinimicrobia bacterium]|nr:MFS transporter [Candidatus Neomarinimicrobiota bacterium]